jgi:hypothetical protein
MNGGGRGICRDATNPAAVLRWRRVCAAYRLVYGADDDMAAITARQRDEAMRYTYATPGDPWGDHHRGRRYLAAYAAVIAEADAAGEPVYSVERIAELYATR